MINNVITPGVYASREEQLKLVVEKQPKVQKVGEPLIDDFRELMNKRAGRAGFRGLTCILRRMDKNGDKKLSPQEFADGLQMYGVEYKRGELDRLFRFLDKDKSGLLSVTEFIRGVRPEMPMARRDIVNTAWYLIDRNSDGKVTIAELAELYDTSQHPEVIAGKKTPEQVLEDFMNFWDKDGNHVVTKGEFMEYYTDISAGIDNDLYFELMIRNAWHISGGEGPAQNTSCLRVLVKFEDGRQGVVEVKDDLGLKRSDIEGIKQRLIRQGIRHIKEVHVHS